MSPCFQNNHSQTERKCDSNNRASALPVQSSEFKAQFHQKKKEKKYYTVSQFYHLANSSSFLYLFVFKNFFELAYINKMRRFHCGKVYFEHAHLLPYIHTLPPPFSNSVWWVSLCCLHICYLFMYIYTYVFMRVCM
jgi:hypothetical protein